MIDFQEFLYNCDKLVEDAVQESQELRKPINYDEIRKYLEGALWEDHRKATTIYFYGSRMYGLAKHKSDLDIFVDVHDEGGKI
jgi:predicted nucleotidyltransferase